MVVGQTAISGAYIVNYAKNVAVGTERTIERFELCKDLYFKWCLMKKIKPNMNEGWFKSKKFIKYREEIGWEKCDFNYALKLYAPQKYDEPKPLCHFTSEKGKTILSPPQNMFKAYLTVYPP